MSSNAFALIVYKCFVSLRFLRETFIDMAFFYLLNLWFNKCNSESTRISIKVFVKNNGKG
jgi:hypothetical protein